MRNHFHLGGTLKRTVLFFLCVPLIGFLCLFLLSCQRKERAERDYPVVAVPLTEVDITDEFWAPRMEVNRSVSIPYVFKTSLGSTPGESSLIYKTGEGRATVFKTIEGSAYSLAKHPDPELETYIDALTDKIVKELLPQDYEKKWESSYWDRRLYDFGHFFEAAVAYHQATGNSKILDAAVKLANHLDSIYGPEKRHFAPSHEEVEIGLVKLYRQTGNEKYWRLAKFFLDERGNAEGRRSYETWGQDHKPVVEQTEAVGHCVMATYLYISMADMAALSGDSRYSAALDKIWEDVVFRKTHLTGGIGSIRFHEQFGAPYELPNVSCWDETCAAIGNAIWNHRLFLLHCDAKYIDMMERILYNGFLVGVSLKGNRFFYQNVLKSFGKYERFSWINVPCCPPNILRLMASLGSYIYAKTNKEIYINLFVDSRARIRLDNSTVQVKQETRYPWEGTVKMTIDSELSEKFSIFVRIPGWTQNQPMPGDLYRYMEKSKKPVTLKVNGKEVELRREKGYVKLERKWKKGDVIELDLPMPVRRVLANEKVKEDEGLVALERGPVVYCAESADNQGNVLNLYIPDDATFKAEYREDLLNGVEVIRGNVLAMIRGEDKKTIEPRPSELVAIPYYAWADRGMGEMAVWLARRPSKARVTPILPPLPISRVSAFGQIKLIPKGYGDQNDDISAVYDGVDPISSADESSTYFRFRPPEGRPAWVEYEFEKPKEVSSAQVYWVDDRRFCRLPESWRILYKDGSQWKSVKNYEPYSVEKDTFNVVIFEPVKTKAVLLEVEPQKILYKAGSIGPPDALYIHKDIVWRECGIIEWRVK